MKKYGRGFLTMAEYIKRETLLERAEYDNNYRRIIPAEAIKAAPAADVAPVVHARWIHSRYDDCSEQFELVKCSQCNHEAYAMAFYVRGGNYCPNCGAKMDGGDNDACVGSNDFCNYGERKDGED